jgi:hypothetical protein
MKAIVFWYIMHTLVEKYRLFRGMYGLHFQGMRVSLEVKRSTDIRKGKKSHDSTSSEWEMVRP